jgi:hypothetical protein
MSKRLKGIDTTIHPVCTPPLPPSPKNVVHSVIVYKAATINQTKQLTSFEYVHNTELYIKLETIIKAFIHQQKSAIKWCDHTKQKADTIPFPRKKLKKHINFDSYACMYHHQLQIEYEIYVFLWFWFVENCCYCSKTLEFVVGKLGKYSSSDAKVYTFSNVGW